MVIKIKKRSRSRFRIVIHDLGTTPSRSKTLTLEDHDNINLEQIVNKIEKCFE